MELLSPSTQMDGVESSKPVSTPPAIVADYPVSAETHLQSSEQEEAVVENAENVDDRTSSPKAKSSMGDTTTLTQVSQEPEQETATYEQSKFAPINTDETNNFTLANKKGPADEIVVGTRGRKAGALAAKNPKSAEDKPNVGAEDGAEEEVPTLRVSKRKRISRYVLDPETDDNDEDQVTELEERPVTNRSTKVRHSAREKLAGTQQENSAIAEPVDSQASLNDINQRAQNSNGSMVPVDAPIRPARRSNNPNSNKKRRLGLKFSLSDELVMNSSDSEQSDTPLLPATMATGAASMDALLQEDPVHEPAEDPEPADDGQIATNPTRVIIGFWKVSDAEDDDNKHAIQSVLSANGQLRTRVLKETRDGTPYIGNHPPGAGSVWRHWHEIELNPHINHFTKAQIKEYTRIRLEQKAAGEMPADEAANEIVAANLAEANVPKGDDEMCRDIGPDEKKMAKAVAATVKTPLKRKARASSVMPRRKRTPPTVQQINERAEHHVIKAEAAQRRHSQRAATAAPAAADAAPIPRPASASETTAEVTPARTLLDSAPPAGSVRFGPNVNIGPNRRVFDQTLRSTQRIWEAQSQDAAREGLEDSKWYLGNRYEFKPTGSFAGMYVTRSTLIEIDGEEFVESRVIRRVGGGR